MREPNATRTGGTDPELPNLATRFVQVLVSPAGVFDRLRERPAWIGALLLIIAIGLAVQAAIPTELVREAFLERLPPDVSPDAVEGQIRFGNAMRFVGTALFTPIFYALLAGLLLLVFNVFAGGEATFRQLYSVAVHSSFVVVLGGLLTLPLMLARRDLELQLSLALLVPGLDHGSYAFRFLNGLNVFGVWAAIVLGIAVSRVYRKRSATAPVVILLGLYVLTKAGLALFRGPGG